MSEFVGNGSKGTAMVVFVNGRETQTTAVVLEDLVCEQHLSEVRVATALNGEFVPASRRKETPLKPGDRIEIVSPRQGG